MQSRSSIVVDIDTIHLCDTTSDKKRYVSEETGLPKETLVLLMGHRRQADNPPYLDWVFSIVGSDDAFVVHKHVGNSHSKDYDSVEVIEGYFDDSVFPSDDKLQLNMPYFFGSIGSVGDPVHATIRILKKMGSSAPDDLSSILAEMVKGVLVIYNNQFLLI